MCEDGGEVATLINAYVSSTSRLARLWHYDAFVFIDDRLRHIRLLEAQGVAYAPKVYTMNKVADPQDPNPMIRREYPVLLPGGTSVQPLLRESVFGTLGVPETDPRFGVLENREGQPRFRLDIPGRNIHVHDPIGDRGLIAHQILLEDQTRAVERLIDLYRRKLPSKYRLVR